MVLKNSAIYFLSANVISEWTRSVRMIDCSVELNRTRTNYRSKYRKEVKLNSTRNRHMELEQNTPRQNGSKVVLSLTLRAIYQLVLFLRYYRNSIECPRHLVIMVVQII